MEYYAEVKVMGDAYGGGFSNGLTMCGSQSAAAFHKVEDRGEDAVYDDDRQHRIVLHKKTVGQAVEISTEFMNDSPEAVTLEMLLSFADQGDCCGQNTQAAVVLECGRKIENGNHRRAAIWNHHGTAVG